MARSLDGIKAKCQLDFFLGLSLREAQAKYSQPKSTVQGWRDEIKDKLPEAAEIRVNRFESAIEDAAVSIAEANTELLLLIKDRNWLQAQTNKENGIEGVLKLLVTTTDNVLNIARATRVIGSEAPALPANTGGVRTVECEIVDE